MRDAGDAATEVDESTARRMEMEIVIDGQRARIDYQSNSGRLVILHTNVPVELRGRGIGGRLVRAVVEAGTRGGVTVVPQCSFARAWLRKHPEVAGRAVIEWPKE